MKLDELQKKLKLIGVNENAYALIGLPHEAYSISASASGWEFYYNQRSVKAVG